MANKLKDMEITSVDLCKRGANQNADIKLFKSAPTAKGGEKQMDAKGNLIDRIAKFLAGAMEPEDGETITKSAGTAQVRETTTALCKSWESIIADDSLSAVEKHDMMAESLQAFTVEATECMESWASAVGKADEPGDDPEDPENEPANPAGEPPEDDNGGEPGNNPENVEKGVFDMATINIEKMSPEDRATLEALEKKYAGSAAEVTEEPKVHPDVQKAIDEVAELRKSLEIKELEGIAKKYEIIGKKAEELAPKLYDLKKAGEQHYNDYVALLDEQVKMAESGIFKEYGSSRGGGTDLDGTVAEIMKSDPSLSRAQAVVKAYQTNPNLDPFTGKAK